MTFFYIFIFFRQMGRQYYLGLGPAVVEVLSDDLPGISEYQKCICLGRSSPHCSVVLSQAATLLCRPSYIQAVMVVVSQLWVVEAQSEHCHQEP